MSTTTTSGRETARETIDVKATRDAALAEQLAAQQRAQQQRETAARDVGWRN